MLKIGCKKYERVRRTLNLWCERGRQFMVRRTVCNPLNTPMTATVAYRGAVRSRKLTPRVYWIMGKWFKSRSVNNLSEEMFKLWDLTVFCPKLRVFFADIVTYRGERRIWKRISEGLLHHRKVSYQKWSRAYWIMRKLHTK